MTKEEIRKLLIDYHCYIFYLHCPIEKIDNRVDKFIGEFAEEYANQKKEVNYQCNKCGAIYTSSSDYVGCCTMHDINRTSGVCGGELIKKIDNNGSI